MDIRLAKDQDVSSCKWGIRKDSDMDSIVAVSRFALSCACLVGSTLEQ
jgi:hypothetical protein